MLRPSGAHTPAADRSLAKLVSHERNPLPGRSTPHVPPTSQTGSTAVDATAATLVSVPVLASLTTTARATWRAAPAAAAQLASYAATICKSHLCGWRAMG